MNQQDVLNGLVNALAVIGNLSAANAALVERVNELTKEKNADKAAAAPVPSPIVPRQE